MGSKVLGQDGTGWTKVSNNEFNTNTNALYLAAGYTCAGTGTVTMQYAHLAVPTAGTANFAKVAVYTFAGALVAVSLPMPVNASGSGPQAPISGTLTGGSKYLIVIQGDVGSFSTFQNSGASNFVDDQNLVANYPYASPPSTLPAPDLTSNGHEFICWIEGYNAPTVTSQPTNQTIASGATATFSVTATASSGSLTYQWYLNGTAIGGATSSSYTTGTQTSTNNKDVYFCLVTDSNGTTQTAVAHVLIKALGDHGRAINELGWFRARRGVDLRSGSDMLLGRNFMIRDKAQAGRAIWNDWAGFVVGGAALAGVAASVSSASGALTTAIQMLANAVSASTATGALTTAIPLAGSASSSSSATGALTTAIQLAAAAQSVSTATGALTTAIVMLANALSTTSATGDLTVPKPLAGAMTDDDTATGSLTTAIQLAAAMVSVVSATGALTTAIQMATDAVSSAAATGSLTTGIPLLGAASDDSSATGALTTGPGGAGIAGDASSSSSATGDLTTGINLAGALVSVTSATGALTTGIQMLAAAVANSVGAAQLSTAIRIAGAATDASSATGLLIIPIPLAGDASDASSASAVLTTRIQAIAAAESDSSFAASLTTAIRAVGNAQGTDSFTASLTTLIQLVANAMSAAAATASLMTGAGFRADATDDSSGLGDLKVVPRTNPLPPPPPGPPVIIPFGYLLPQLEEIVVPPVTAGYLPGTPAPETPPPVTAPYLLPQ